MRKAVRCAVLLLTVPWVSACGTVSSYRPPPVVGEMACTVVVSQVTGSAFYEPVRIVGEHINHDEWWVVFVTRDPSEFLGPDGKERAVNVPKLKILRKGEYRSINGVVCHCPQ